MQVTVEITDEGLLKHQLDKMALLDGRINLCNTLYVAAGLKPVTRFLVREEHAEQARKFISGLGLETYTSELRAFDKGIKRMIYISKTRELAEEAFIAETAGDHRTFGALLGYPECCIRAFTHNYRHARQMHDDCTLFALENSQGMSFPLHMNISMRYFDRAFISHFPCSLDCSRSLELAKRYAECIARCAPHIYDETVSTLGTAVIYSNDTGVHAFRGVDFTHDGFTYRDVRLTSENEFHHLLKQGNRIKVVDKHHFLIMYDGLELHEINDPLIGVMMFNQI